MGIKHSVVKASNEAGYSYEWNDEHIIDGDIDFNGFSGINLGEPINPSDVATKNYVDTQAGGPTGTFYWSCPGSAFMPGHTPSDYNDIYNIDGHYTATFNNANLTTTIFLPQGAIVTGCVVYGDVARTWTLKRCSLTAGTSETMATAKVGTVDTTINNATIDNQTYGYYIWIASTQNYDDFYGARITYTL